MKFAVTLLSCIFYLSLSNSLMALSIETKNMRDITITKVNFVYMEAQGTVEDTFDEERRTILQHILQYGIVTKRTAIVFLDHFAPSETYVKNYKDNQRDYAEEALAKGISVKSQFRFNVTQKYLDDNFGRVFLKTNRKVLVGVLLFPNISVTPTNTIKVLKLDQMTVQGYQSLMPLSPSEPPYSNFDRIYDRTSMMKYMAAVPSDGYIGMAEIFDEDNGTLTFLAIKGDQTMFIEENGISPLKPGFRTEN